MAVVKKNNKNNSRRGLELNSMIAKKNALVIQNEKEFDRVVKKVEMLMNKGSMHISEEEFAEIRRLSLAAQEYENNKYTIDPPKTLEGIIEWIMYQQRLKQKDMASALGISDTKLSMVMCGKQKPDVVLLKSLHEKYGVNAEILLSVV